MRKIFRMGYEPCKGDCYAWDDVLPIDDLDPEKRAAVKTKLLDLHRPMCGNAALRYGVDFDEHRRLRLSALKACCQWWMNLPIVHWPIFAAISIKQSWVSILA